MGGGGGGGEGPKRSVGGAVVAGAVSARMLRMGVRVVVVVFL